MAVHRADLGQRLEALYSLYNRRDLVSPDPLQFLYDYPAPEDREIVGFIASALAYGRVKTILSSIDRVLAPMGSSPRAFLADSGPRQWRELYGDFRHRFTDGAQVVSLLEGLRSAVDRYGSLQGLVVQARQSSGSLLGALEELIAALEGGGKSSLLARPSRNSACKRHFLFLRWMVRCDAVDPGGWDRLDPAELLIPLDTHMYAICRSLGFSDRKGADLKTAQEITEAFRRFVPQDPARYDFVLTRFGIRQDMTVQELLRLCGAGDGEVRP